MYNIHILSYKWEIQVDTVILFKIAIAMYVNTRAEVTVLSIRIQKATTLENLNSSEILYKNQAHLSVVGLCRLCQHNLKIRNNTCVYHTYTVVIRT